MSRMQGSNANVNFPQHGDAEGTNPGIAPSVSANFTSLLGAQTTPSAPTRHIPVVNHQRAVPNSPISPPLDPRDGILSIKDFSTLTSVSESIITRSVTFYRPPVIILKRFQSRRCRRFWPIPRLATPDCRQIQVAAHLLLPLVLQMMRRSLII